MMRTVVAAQCLAKLQEARQFHLQVEAAQKKEVVLKARLGPWLDETYIISTNVQGKLVSL